MPRREQSRLADALPDLVSAILGKLASLGALAFVVALLYFAYALFAGYVAAYPQYAWAFRVKIAGNLQVASYLLVAATFCVLAYALIHFWEHEELPAYLLLGGILFYFAPPFLLAEFVRGPLHTNRAATIIHGALTNAGQLLLVAAALRIVPLLLHHARTALVGFGQDSAVRQAAKKQPGLIHPFSPCWKLPFCRRYIRDHCPRHKERKTCWRTKRGCMCDDDIVTMALMGGAGTSTAARERLMLEYLPGGGGRGVVGKRLKCQNCFIFLEHQRIKHRYAAPASLPALAVVFWLIRGSVESGYQSACAWATRGVQSVALGQVNTGVIWETFTSPAVKWLILLCVALFVVTYFMRFLEFLFFKLKV
ncbi:MAG: hypothetical protein GX774_18270 [Armatimonadetes bacterium]|nr:hypothetical protein [Armatimonadota bacterium]